MRVTPGEMYVDNSSLPVWFHLTFLLLNESEEMGLNNKMLCNRLVSDAFSKLTQRIFQDFFFALLFLYSLIPFFTKPQYLLIDLIELFQKTSALLLNAQCSLGNIEH